MSGADESVPPEEAAGPAEDAALLDALRAALGPDPAPPGIVERAGELVTFFDIDAELDALLAAAAAPVGVRGAGDATADPRLAFRAPGLAVELDIGVGSVSGQVLEGDVRSVLVDRPDADAGVVSAVVDELGRFVVTGLAPGPARLRLVDEAGSVSRTEWFLVG